MFNHRCRILANQSVLCDLDIYQKVSEWETHKERIDDMIREYRKALEDLRVSVAVCYFVCSHELQVKDSKNKCKSVQSRCHQLFYIRGSQSFFFLHQRFSVFFFFFFAPCMLYIIHQNVIP